MGRQQIDGGELRRSMQEQFEREGRELLLTASNYPLVESIMRLRALSEISAELSTDRLLELTLTVVEGTDCGS
jgi:hypothetical protein